MGKTEVRIGPGDNGRRMSLAEFDLADGDEGHLYELGNGVITVVDVPGRPHFDQVYEAKRQLFAYGTAHPRMVYRIGGGGEVKLIVAGAESERHPDVALYKRPPDDEDHLWATWVPDLVIEVVSPGSADRDYVEKREEYLRFGVREYWIIDPGRGESGEMLVLRRVGGRWVEKIVRPPGIHCPRLLPDLAFDVAAVFRAARG
jgi:Uma2 family endonuclease